MVFVPSLEVTNLIDSLYHNELYPGSMLWVWALKHLMFHHGQDQLKYTNQVDPWYRSKNSAKLQIWLPFRNFLWIQLLGQGIIFEMGISGDPNHLCFSSNRLNTQPIVVEACLKYWMMPVLLGETNYLKLVGTEESTCLYLWLNPRWRGTPWYYYQVQVTKFK